MPPLSALLFSGNFNYDLGEDAEISKSQKLTQIANYWQEDFKTFRAIVEEKFLASANDSLGQSVVEESIFPGTLL